MHLSTSTKETSVLHAHETTTTCKNCGNHFIGRYCNACGQRADTHRINWHYIWHEIPHSVWHVDHGILFTLKELIVRPGHTIREFLEGKRVKHYRPLALVLLLGAVLTFLLHSLKVNMMEETGKTMGQLTGDTSNGSEEAKQFQTQANAFAEKYLNIIQILLLPVTSLFTWRFFKKKGLNYPEHLVANTFLLNFSLLTSLAVVLCYKLFGGTVGANSVIQVVQVIAWFAYTTWAFSQLFKGKVSRWGALWRTVAASLLSYISLGIVGGLVGAMYGFFLVRSEVKKQNEPNSAKPAIHAPLPKK